MKLSFHISFLDGSNPYYSFPKEASKTIKEVNHWYKNNRRNHFDIFTSDHKYRISNTAWGTWVVYKKEKYISCAISKQYDRLGNAVKFLKKEIQKELDNTYQTC